MNRHRDAGIFAASVAVTAIVTASYSWTVVLLGWIIGAVVMLLTQNRSGSTVEKGSACVILLGGILVLAAAALGAEDAFPEDSTFPFVSAGLFLLLWRAMCGERETGGVTANLLGMILLPVLAVVVIFGLKDVSWTENKQLGGSWMQVLAATAAVCPWWCFRQGKLKGRNWGWFLASASLSVGMCLLTRGILGSGLVEAEPFPLYRAVQSIRILGVLQRMEALLAATVLMGAFSVMLLTGEQVADALDVLLPKQKKKWKSGCALLAAFLIENGFRALQSGTAKEIQAVFWGLLLVLALWVVFSRKNEEPAKRC